MGSDEGNAPKTTLILSGQARIPKGLSENQVIQVVIELNGDNHEVTNVSVHPSLDVVQNFLRRAMIGINLETGFTPLLETIQNRMNHRSKMGILTALKDLMKGFHQAQNPDAPLPLRNLDEYQW